MNSEIDHLVVIADSLEQGVAWSEQVLGVTPGPGGEHPLMGTHNRLLRIDGPGFERAYLEIIAIKPGASPLRQPPLRRWFDMDNAALMAQLRQHGPQLCHWVVRTNELTHALSQCQQHGWDRGPALQASRMSPGGLLEWRISVRDDGQRLLDGVLPTLIQWGSAHPVDAMPASGLRLKGVVAQHPEAPSLRSWAEGIGLAGVQWRAAAAGLQVLLDTPVGEVWLKSRV